MSLVYVDGIFKRYDYLRIIFKCKYNKVLKMLKKFLYKIWNRLRWYVYQLRLNRNYLKELRKLDPHGTGVILTCPDCGSNSYVKLPKRRYYHPPIIIACPTACGAYGSFSDFNPVQSDEKSIKHYDSHKICKIDGSEFAVDGVIFRCPTCAIENPREVIKSVVEGVKKDLSTSNDRKNLVDCLSTIISHFDGIMRICNNIARKNQKELGLPQIQRINSFQNIVAARDKMINSSSWDMANIVTDWDKFVRIFQKRHLFAHTLGVVDQAYLDKTGDTEAILGKQVPLSENEILFIANESVEIVSSFFGNFLS